MKTNKYDELKIKYEALLEENKCLKAKIREFDSNAKVIIPHDEARQPMETLFQELEGSVSKQQSDTITLNDNFPNNKPVTRRSLNHEKISLFMSLFRGRKEVYAKKWQNKKGFSGYSPVCLNEWTPGICNKPKIKCAKCENQSYGPLNESLIEKHLRGGAVIGIYPMNLDETCHFLAIDFDKEGWKKDISVVRNTCSQFEIPVAIERSQSGNGCHAWFFFDQKISAVSARKFGNSVNNIITEKRASIASIQKGNDELHSLTINMPPLPISVIQESNSVSDLIPVALQLRQDYQELREWLGYFQQAMSDGKYKEIAKFQKIIHLISLYVDSLMGTYDSNSPTFSMGIGVLKIAVKGQPLNTLKNQFDVRSMINNLIVSRSGSEELNKFLGFWGHKKTIAFFI